METNRIYINEEQARGYANERNIAELPSINHSISSILSDKERKDTGISCLNLGQDNKGYFISKNEYYG